MHGELLYVAGLPCADKPFHRVLQNGFSVIVINHKVVLGENTVFNFKSEKYYNLGLPGVIPHHPYRESSFCTNSM